MMASERKFIRENTKRSLIKKFLVKEIEGAGFGGMSIQRTPIGTRINILVERPGMVIGKGGVKIKELTSTIHTRFDVENPQIEIQEAGASAALNAQIMAEKLAEALQRGWHFRRAGHSTIRRIMNAGAKGCQIVIAGKLTGARHRTEKFTEGHVKYCGEVALEVMDNGFAEEKTEEKKVEEKTAEKKKTDIKKIIEIPGIGASIVKKLEKAKIGSLEELYEMDIDGILSIEGIGKKTAETIIKNLKKLIEEGT